MGGQFGMARQHGFSRRNHRRSQRQVRTVLWVSDHELYDEQRAILRSLYGQDVEIIQFQGMQFRKQFDFVDFLRENLDSIVYAVVPKAQLIQAVITGMEEGFSFGYFTFDRGSRHRVGMIPAVKSVYYFDGRVGKLLQPYIRSKEKPRFHSVPLVIPA